jgi:hypothetical protein
MVSNCWVSEEEEEEEGRGGGGGGRRRMRKRRRRKKKIYSKQQLAMNEVDAERDRATPAKVRATPA